MTTTVPRKIPKIWPVLSPLFVGAQFPHYVPVRPDPAAQFDDCFFNVDGVVARSGGTMVTGWSLWESPGVLAEAIHYAVWQSPEGTLIDVTPTRGHHKRVLFSSDPAAIFDRTLSRRRPNRMRELSNDPAVMALVAAANGLFQYLGELGQGQIEAARSGKDATFDALSGAHLSALHRVYDTRLRPTDCCICGSGRKFFRCCRVIPSADTFVGDRQRRRICIMPQAMGLMAT